MAETEEKRVTLAECEQHTTEQDCWLIIHGKVYDVTDFLDEHPGGYDIVVSASGKDATEEFEEIGHSKTAKEMLDKYYIGQFAGGAKAEKKAADKKAGAAADQNGSLLTSIMKALMPLVVMVIAIAYALYGAK